MIKLGELLEITMQTEITKNLLRTLNVNSENIEKYYNIIIASEAADIEISTYEDYKRNYNKVIELIQPLITPNEESQLIRYQVYLDRLVLETFKLLT